MVPPPSLAALTGINDALAEHLPDEEESIVPAMEAVLDQEKVDAAADHGRKAVPKGQSFAMLGAIMAAQPDGGTAWQRKNLPPPARMVWRYFGRRRYDRGRAALEHGPR